MANDLFTKFGHTPPEQMSGPFGNVADILNKYNEFANNLQGDPKQQVQNLLNSGRMSQPQFNWLSQMAQAFQQLIHR